MNKQSKALGEQCSSKQRLTEVFTGKQAIMQCRAIHQDEYFDIKNLPGEFVAEIDARGYSDYLRLTPKCKISVPKGRDAMEYVINFILRLNNVGELKQRFNPMTLNNHKKR